jgi:hypothetical protein
LSALRLLRKEIKPLSWLVPSAEESEKRIRAMGEYFGIEYREGGDWREQPHYVESDDIERRVREHLEKFPESVKVNYPEYLAISGWLKDVIEAGY